LYIAGAGMKIGPLELVADAVRDGRYPAEVAARSEQYSLSVMPDDTPIPSLAVEAAMDALNDATERGFELDPTLLVHTAVRDSGCDGWLAAARIQLDLGIRDCEAYESGPSCNGLRGIRAAALMLRGDHSAQAALVTACDTWPEPMVDRWSDAAGFLLGDGGGAVLLTKQPTPLRLRTVVTTLDPELEGMTRGAHPMFGPRPERMDLRRRYREFEQTAGTTEEIWERRDAGLTATVGAALAEAKTTIGQITRVIVPHLDRDHLTREILLPLGLEIERTTWDMGTLVGHLGAADLYAGLSELLSPVLVPARPDLEEGDQILMVGVGGGYSWGAAVVEVVAPLDEQARD
jgi:3-oxoacyl-[acyl-carrier-protein] synthase-3